MMICVTHQNPDWDSVMFAWLVDRFLVDDDEEIDHHFINLANPDVDLLARADFVGDAGWVYDPARGRYDRHQLLEDEARSTCAAKMLFDRLVLTGKDIKYLTPLILLIWQGDIASQEADQSRQLGIHALLSAYKTERHTDAEILDFGFDLLDLIAGQLKRRAEHLAELNDKIVYRSLDGLVLGVVGGGTGVTFAAEEVGARLVVFAGKPIEGGAGNIVSYPVGISRLGGAEVSEPHIGHLVERVQATTYHDLTVELTRWFKHPAGFFAGRGTGKAIDPTPPPTEKDIKILAAKIDAAWKR